MKVLKIILILALLFSMNVFGQTPPIVRNRTLEIPKSWYRNIGDKMNWDPDYTYWSYAEVLDKPDTLLEWFKGLTLDEKVEVYNWWKYESVNLKIVSEYGELFIRLDKED